MRWLAPVLWILAGCTPETLGAVPAPDEPDRMTDVNVVSDVAGRTAWSLHAREAAARPDGVLLTNVHASFPHGLAAAARPAPAPAPDLAADATPMEIEADRLEVDRKAGRATFTGRVVAVRGKLTLRCDRIVADYEPEGALRTVIAEGAVTVDDGRLHAEAARATYLEAERAVALEGALRISDGHSTLTGERARILVDEERFVVERARGKLVFKPAAAPPAAPPRSAP